MSWHEIPTEEEFGEALSFASSLIPKEKVRIALVGDGAHWIWNHLKRPFQAEAVIWSLQRMTPKNEESEKEIKSLITYLKNNHYRINYDSAKKGGYPPGSGGFESANKFICHIRLKRLSILWYVIYGNAMLRLRCSIYNGTFDAVFSHYKTTIRLCENL